MIYICQCPHQMPAKVWTTFDQFDALSRMDSDFDNLDDAIADDVRDAYATDDVINMLLWIDSAEAPGATKARTAFSRCREVRNAIEALATEVERDDDFISTAFDGRFTWSENDSEWTIDNQPPVAADDLFEALCAAAILVGRSEQMEQTDV